jgi:hypothetical protein
MAKGSFCSRASQYRNGETISLQLLTWDLVHISVTLSARMAADMYLGTLKMLEMMRHRSIRFAYTGQMLGKSCIDLSMRGNKSSYIKANSSTQMIRMLLACYVLPEP